MSAPTLPALVDLRGQKPNVAESSGMETRSAFRTGPVTFNMPPAGTVNTVAYYFAGFNCCQLTLDPFSGTMSLDISFMPLDPITLAPFFEPAIGLDLAIPLFLGVLDSPTGRYLQFGWNTIEPQSCPFMAAFKIQFVEAAGGTGNITYTISGVSVVGIK